jgi:hypothetical protein
MSGFPDSIAAAARTLIAQYGDDAEIVAVMRAAEFAANGDEAGLAAWDEIIACIAAMEAGGPAAGALN